MRMAPGHTSAASIPTSALDPEAQLNNTPDTASYEQLLAGICYEHTIPRALAHKRRLENVYVTSLSRLGESEFLFGAFVPQSNVYINDLRSHPGDVTLALIEIGRQFGLALSHRYLHVDTNTAFVLNDMRLETCPAWRSVDWRKQETVWGRARFHSHRYSDTGDLIAVHAEGAFHVGERPLCRQSSSWTIQPSERYARLRELTRGMSVRRRAAARVAPAGFESGFALSASPQGRRVIEDTIWADAAGQRFAATLYVDQGNLFFFDHDNDHVPGMLILEGMRRFATDIAARYRSPVGGQSRLRVIEVGFRNFAELDDPVRLVATMSRSEADSAPKVLTVEARQHDYLIATGRFEFE